MEVTTEIFGEHTRKAFGAVPPEGLEMTVRDTSNILVPKDRIKENLTRFFLDNAGIRELPSGNIREAAIQDTIEEARKLRLQSSLRFLAGSRPAGELFSCKYNKSSGEVGNFDGTWTLIDRLRSIVVGGNKVQRDKDMSGYDLGDLELEMDNDGQITAVTFVIEIGDAQKLLRKGLTKSQLMVMTAVAENNRGKAGSNLSSRPDPQLKIEGVRQDGTFARSETFWKVFNQ